METIDPGSLKRRITFQTQSTTADSYGDAQAAAWVDTAIVAFASITPVTSGESVRAMAVQSEISHRIVCRYRAAILPTMRIKYGARYFKITGIRNLNEENEYLEIAAVEGVVHD